MQSVLNTLLNIDVRLEKSSAVQLFWEIEKYQGILQMGQFKGYDTQSA